MAAKPQQAGMSGMNTAGMGELWARLKFLFFAILVYRIGAHIPVPGIDPIQLQNMFRQQQDTILSLFNMFSGGALEHAGGRLLRALEEAGRFHRVRGRRGPGALQAVPARRRLRAGGPAETSF